MIYKARQTDTELIAELSGELYGSLMETKEIEELINSKEAAIFVLEVKGEIVGFAQCQLRHDYVEGCNKSPVGYLEGIFVKSGHRRRGYGRKLVRACEKWAKESGCREFASDCQLDNNESLAFHLSCGFIEAGRIICFYKQL